MVTEGPTIFNARTAITPRKNRSYHRPKASCERIARPPRALDAARKSSPGETPAKHGVSRGVEKPFRACLITRASRAPTCRGASRRARRKELPVAVKPTLSAFSSPSLSLPPVESRGSNARETKWLTPLVFCPARAHFPSPNKGTRGFPYATGGLAWPAFAILPVCRPTCSVGRRGDRHESASNVGGSLAIRESQCLFVGGTPTHYS